MYIPSNVPRIKPIRNLSIATAPQTHRSRTLPLSQPKRLHPAIGLYGVDAIKRNAERDNVHLNADGSDGIVSLLLDRLCRGRIKPMLNRFRNVIAIVAKTADTTPAASLFRLTAPTHSATK
jgi:hypothetical protein